GPDIVLQVGVHLAAEASVVLRLAVSRFQLENQRHQRLGDEAATIEPEMPALVGPGAERIELLDGHMLLMALSGAARLLAPSRAAAVKARILSASFSPGVRSLLPGRALDAGGDADAGRGGDAQRFCDVERVEAAREHERRAGLDILE